MTTVVKMMRKRVVTIKKDEAEFPQDQLYYNWKLEIKKIVLLTSV